jgi:hypothetical protein
VWVVLRYREFGGELLEGLIEMRAKLRLSLVRYRAITAVLFPRVVLVLLASVVLHGCIRVSLEGLPEAVETAMKRSMIRHKTEIVEKVRGGVDAFAAAQMRRLNAAERVYGRAMSFKGMPDPNPMKLGFLFKSRRDFNSYEIVDVIDTGSLLKDPYEVIVKYNYEVWETQRRSSGDPASGDMVRRDTDFQKTEQKGSLRFLYRFNPDLEWNREPGIRLLTEVAPSLAPASVAPAPVGAPPDTPPEQQAPSELDDLPVPLTQIGGEKAPPPSVLIDGLRSSPLLKNLPRRKRTLD